MLTFVLVLFILSCVVLILSVLLQSGRGGGLGEIFGGGGERALFGGTGAAGFMVKITIGAAVVFITTSLILSVMYMRQGSIRSVPQVPSGPVAPSGIPLEESTPPLPVEKP